MERASTFFGNLGETLQNIARWIIRFGRRYQIAPAAYLVAFFVCVFGYTNQSSVPPPPPPPPSAQNQTPAYTTTVPTAPPLTPAVAIAQAQAYKNGNSVIIRWNQPVSNPYLTADGSSLTASCQPQTCTAPLTQQVPVNQVEATWNQGGQYFKKKFHL